MSDANPIDALLSDFDLGDHAGEKVREGRPMTVWLPLEDKARYDRLQKQTGNRFSKKVREVVTALIRAAEAKAS